MHCIICNFLFHIIIVARYINLCLGLYLYVSFFLVLSDRVFHAILFDITPRQLLQIAGHSLSAIYKWQLSHYRYGMGVYKIDWALDAPIPFTAEPCRQSGTIHLGNTMEEIVAAEKFTANGGHPEKPFILLKAT